MEVLLYMDITYKKDDFSFQYRVSACIFNNDMTKVLVFQAKGREAHLLVGGKVHEYEESIDALKREVKEELGWSLIDISLLAISEELVHDKGLNHHQINLIYKAIYTGDIKEQEFHGLEGEWIRFKWIDVEKIENYKIYPTKIKEIIKDPNKMYHIVDNLIKNETL